MHIARGGRDLSFLQKAAEGCLGAAFAPSHAGGVSARL